MESWRQPSLNTEKDEKYSTRGGKFYPQLLLQGGKNNWFNKAEGLGDLGKHPVIGHTISCNITKGAERDASVQAGPSRRR